MSQKTSVLYAKIGQVKPPRWVRAGGMADAYIGGIDMTDSTCSVEECGDDSRSRGMCVKHYTRFRRHGSPYVRDPRGAGPLPAAERFWCKVEFTDDCWLWTGDTTSDGYGRFRIDGHKRVMAHRWVYEDRIGPIPDGLQVDHLCFTTSCVNPDHLEAVTQQENLRRKYAQLSGHEN